MLMRRKECRPDIRGVLFAGIAAAGEKGPDIDAACINAGRCIVTRQFSFRRSQFKLRHIGLSKCCCIGVADLPGYP
jgi:hypothetical protein